MFYKLEVIFRWTSTLGATAFTALHVSRFLHLANSLWSKDFTLFVVRWSNFSSTKFCNENYVFTAKRVYNQDTIQTHSRFVACLAIETTTISIKANILSTSLASLFLLPCTTSPAWSSRFGNSPFLWPAYSLDDEQFQTTIFTKRYYQGLIKTKLTPNKKLYLDLFHSNFSFFNILFLYFVFILPRLPKIYSLSITQHII